MIESGVLTEDGELGKNLESNEVAINKIFLFQKSQHMIKIFIKCKSLEQRSYGSYRNGRQLVILPRLSKD